MKGIDMRCASQASTAIMDAIASSSSSSSSSSAQLGGRAIDRHNPIIRDGRRLRDPPCSSLHPPINPKPYHQLPKSKPKPKPKLKSKKPSPNPPTIDHKKSVAVAETEDVIVVNNNIAMIPSGESMRRQADLFTPPGSTRYLLTDAPPSSDYDSQSSSVSTQSKDQVVVLRVSLHCKGCEGKLRKHLSRMKGVTSFNIDFAAKKVTVTGDVTPVSVLASVSKVKSAQFWAATKVEPKK